MRSSPSFRRGGFTLIELLVVIAIIAVLIGLLLPAVQKVREAAARAKCQNNMKQVVLGFHNFHDANQAFPPGQTNPISAFNASGTTFEDVSWAVMILPYLEQGNVYNMVYPGLSTSDLSAGAIATAVGADRVVIPSLVCPSDPNGPIVETNPWYYNGFRGNVVACAGSDQFFGRPGGGTNLNGVFYPRSKTKILDITDGSSNTIAVSELRTFPSVGNCPNMLDNGFGEHRGRYWDPWNMRVAFSTFYPPNTTNADQLPSCCNSPSAPCITPAVSSSSVPPFVIYARSAHTNGINAAKADGSVTFVSNSISQSTWQAVGSRAGGEVPGSDW